MICCVIRNQSHGYVATSRAVSCQADANPLMIGSVSRNVKEKSQRCTGRSLRCGLTSAVLSRAGPWPGRRRRRREPALPSCAGRCREWALARVTCPYFSPTRTPFGHLPYTASPRCPWRRLRHGRQALLHRGGRPPFPPQLLDPGRDMHRLDTRQGQSEPFAPSEEPGCHTRIGGAGVRVADVGGEKLDIAPDRTLTLGSDQGRHKPRPSTDGQSCLVGNYQRAGHRACHGLISGTPQPAKSPSRVAIDALCTWAMAAIMPSIGLRRCPACWRLPAMAA